MRPPVSDGAITAAVDDLGASNGQVLKWNGTTWAPAADAQGITSVSITAGSGITVSGASQHTVANSGDTNASDDLTTGSNASGDVTGPFSNLQIAAGVVGTAEITNAGVGTVDLADLAVTNAKIGDNAVTTVKIANGAVTAAKIDNMNASNGQVIKWNGTTWAPAADALGTVTLNDGAGINVTGSNGVYTITNTGDTDPFNDLTTFSQADGDISGPFNNLNIKSGTVGSLEIMLNGVATTNIAPGAVTGAKIAQMGATSGKVLKWNGTSWAPGDDLNGGTGDNWGSQVVVTNATLTGTGVAGNVLGLAAQGATNGQVLKFNGTSWVPGTVPGDDWGAQVVQKGNALTGNGTAGSPLNLATQGATNGQVLKFNGTSWVPADDATGGGGGTGDTYSAGTGIDITGASPNFTIVNTGDLSNTNEIQVLSLAGNQLSLSNGGGSVNLPGGNNYAAGPGISITGSAPNFTINNTGDADEDPINELQTLSLNGSKLKISQTNTVVNFDTLLSGMGSGLWLANGNNINNTNSGNVGINNAAPAVKLHVKGNGEALRVEGTTPLIGLTNGSGAPNGFVQQANSGLVLGTTGTLDIDLRPGGLNGINVAGATGNVGIGGAADPLSCLTLHHKKAGLTLENATTGQSWTMTVNEDDGTLQLFSSLSPLTPTGTFDINGVYTPSDRRLKRDVANLPGVLDKMMLLNPVTYHYTFEKTTAPMSVGFLAQDVEALFPELVGHTTARDGNKYLALNYAGFSVLTVKAIQEQQAEIDNLKRENEDLRKRTESLEARMSKMEQLMHKN